MKSTPTLLALVTLTSLLTNTNAFAGGGSNLDPKKAVYAPSHSRKGGETGNGGDSTVSAQTAAIAARAGQEIKNLCMNHPEYRNMKPCLDEPEFTKRLEGIAWAPAPRIYLCKDNKVVIGGLPETATALETYGPCTERDAVNFGDERDHNGRQVILLSQARYRERMSNLDQQGSALLQNILHEVLSLTGAEGSDSYSSSQEWVQFLSRYSRLSRIYSTFHQPDLVTLMVDSDLDPATSDEILAIMASKGYAKSTEAKAALYRLNLSRRAVTRQMFDGSQDMILTVTLERLSDEGVSQILATRESRYNTLRPMGELPENIRGEVRHWLKSQKVPQGIL